MPPLYHHRRRFTDAARPHRVPALAVALALAILMSFQIATQTVARLLWPSHMHVALQAQRDGVGGHSPCRWLDACVHEQAPAAPIHHPRASPAAPLAMHAASLGYAGVVAQSDLPARADHLRLWLERAKARTPLRQLVDSPLAEDAVAVDAGLQHSHIQILSHALAHAAGLGHHRHATGTADVIYVDDDDPRVSAKWLIRFGDISLMLLSAQPPLQIYNLSSAAPSGPPPLALIVRSCLPGKRPPR